MRYASWLSGRPLFVLTIALAVAAVSIYLLRYAVFNSDYAVFFSEDDPEVRRYAELLDAYTNTSSVFVVVAPHNKKVFDPVALRAVSEITEAGWDLPGVIRVDSIANFQHARWVDGQLVVGTVLDESVYSDRDALEAAKRTILSEPILLNRLINPQGSVTGVNIQIGDSFLPAVEAARQLQTKIEAQYPVAIGLTGGVMLNNGFREATIKDLYTMTPAVTLILIATMALLLRSLPLTVATFIIVGLACGSALGLASALGAEISGPVAPSPIMIMTLGVANCVHLLATFNWQLRHGNSRDVAMIEAMRVNATPIFLTNLTTCIGFLSMTYKAVPPMQTMALVTALGVLFAFIYSMTILPAVICLLRFKQASGSTDTPSAFARLGDWVVRNRHVLMLVSFAVTILLMLFIPRITFRNDYVNFLKESEAIRRDTDFAAQNLGGIFEVSWSIPAAGPSAVADPDYLRNLDRFVHWLEEYPGVTHVDSLTSTVKRLNRLLHRDDPAHYAIPDSPEAVSSLLRLYESALPEGLSLRSSVVEDWSASRLIATTNNLGSEEIRKFTDAANAWMAENLPGYMHASPTGPWVLFAHISETMLNGMLVSTPMALVLVSGVLLLALRSIRFGVLSLLPNLLPLGAALGAWGLLGRHLDIAMSGVLAMGIGIIVDDTVHFISKYLRARREKGLSPEDGVRYAFASVGMAMFVTSFVLTAGFLTLMFSRFTTSVNMGLFTTLVIFLALLGDFFFLPPLLMAFDKREKAPNP